jgi:acetyl-CoA carboxylase biotin carboxyl carrier protein
MSDLTEKDLLQLLGLFTDSDMTVLHVRSNDFEVLLSRNLDATALGTLAGDPGPAPAASAVEPAVAAAPAVPPAAPAAVVEPPSNGPEPAAAAEETVLVTAPSLGAFYHSPRPDLPAYVTVGSWIEPDTTVGLIEAMKVFTAVSAGVQGVVREILVGNDEFVEYGQPLIRVAPGADGASSSR